MRRFELHRDEDVSGISGTGTVAEGVAFTNNGPVALRWTSEWPTSVVFHDRGIESLEAIHGHNGRTRIVWLDEEEQAAEQCIAATILTNPFEVVRCEASELHPNQHHGHDSAGTLLLWWEDAVHYSDRSEVAPV